ncbi:MAG: hypothetical protein WC375_12875 [Methanomassiliicoccales archaeon]
MTCVRPGGDYRGRKEPGSSRSHCWKMRCRTSMEPTSGVDIPRCSQNASAGTKIS